MKHDKEAKQTVLVSKKVAKSKGEAIKMARGWADRVYTIRETTNFYHLRQLPPERFRKDSYRSEKVGPGIYVVKGVLGR